MWEPYTADFTLCILPLCFNLLFVYVRQSFICQTFDLKMWLSLIINWHLRYTLLLSFVSTYIYPSVKWLKPFVLHYYIFYQKAFFGYLTSVRYFWDSLMKNKKGKVHTRFIYLCILFCSGIIPTFCLYSVNIIQMYIFLYVFESLRLRFVMRVNPHVSCLTRLSLHGASELNVGRHYAQTFTGPTAQSFTVLVQRPSSYQAR